MNINTLVERAIVASLVRHLGAHGYQPTAVTVEGDGEPAPTEVDVLRHVFETFSASQITVMFGRAFVILTPGNGESIVSNWSASGDRFTIALNTFDAEHAYQITPREMLTPAEMTAAVKVFNEIANKS